MKITVSKHAIEQYKKRMFSKISDHEIQRVLELIAVRGEVVHRNPSKGGRFYTMFYNGLYALVHYCGDRAVVVTFLGDETYRAWHRSNKSKVRAAV